MTGPSRTRRGCSPWAFLGCGCGLLSMIGIAFVFFTLGIIYYLERTDPYWNMEAYRDCQTNLRYLGHAITSYRGDYNNALPTDLAQLKPYIYSPVWLHCPLEDRKLPVKPYKYTPASTGPDTPLITCPNHGQGPVILLHNGLLRLPDDAYKKAWRSTGRKPTKIPIDRGAR